MGSESSERVHVAHDRARHFSRAGVSAHAAHCDTAEVIITSEPGSSSKSVRRMRGAVRASPRQLPAPGLASSSLARRSRARAAVRRRPCRHESQSCPACGPNGIRAGPPHARAAARKAPPHPSPSSPQAPGCRRSSRTARSSLKPRPKLYPQPGGKALSVVLSLFMALPRPSGNQHPEPMGSRRAAPLLPFSTVPGTFPGEASREESTESFAPPCIHLACTVSAHFVRCTPKNVPS
jgi:hypothetical protein